MTTEETAKLLKILSAAYPNSANKITDPESMIMAWQMVLGEFSAEAVYKAARFHLQTNKFFPSPSDIRDKIVRAEITYMPTIPNAIESGATKNCDEYLDKFCEWIGFGCEENDTVELPKGFLPYEV